MRLLWHSCMHAAWPSKLQEQPISNCALCLQDLTAAQLSSLHLAGRQGLRVPLLREFLAACLDAGIRRSLAVVREAVKLPAACGLSCRVRRCLCMITASESSSLWVSLCALPLPWQEVKVLVTDQGRRELIDSIRCAGRGMAVAAAEEVQHVQLGDACFMIMELPAPSWRPDLLCEPPSSLRLRRLMPAAGARRWYLDEHQRRLQPAGAAWQRQCYAPLGWAGVIAFPHFWAPAFGEFGSLQVRTG